MMIPKSDTMSGMGTKGELRGRVNRFRYWLGGPQGALVYFGVLVPMVVAAIILVVTWIAAVPPVPAG